MERDSQGLRIVSGKTIDHSKTKVKKDKGGYAIDGRGGYVKKMGKKSQGWESRGGSGRESR
jgi:hypothetical protein